MNKDRSLSSNNGAYEMVNSQDWSRNDHTIPAVNFRQDSTLERMKQYELTSLDNDWYPVLRDRLRNQRLTSTSSSGDQMDFGLSRSPQRRMTTEDEIDARGKFHFKDLEIELKTMHRSELEDQLGISWTKVKDIIRRSPKDKDGMVEYKDFLETVKRYRLSTEQASTLKSLVKAFAYAEEFTCFPPKWFMIFITLVETCFFTYHAIHLPSVHSMEMTWDGPVPYCSVLIYNPNRRWEAWRYITYMFVHIGISHFVFNMIMQILVGVFLEMEQEGWQGSFRVMFVYFSGVLAGSLGTSLSDPDTFIAGASGGCYALIAAHLATLALNWQEDSAVRIKKVIHKPLIRIVRIIFISFLTVHDICLALYFRYFLQQESKTGFMGHFCGALAGLLIGVFILDNRRVQAWETWVQWISFTLFLILIIFATIWNIFGNQWTNGNFFPVSDYKLYDADGGQCYEKFYV